MNRQEIRDRVNSELRKRGYDNPLVISNKDACKILGLMPDNVVGIGSANGSRMLKAWLEGNPIHYEQLGAILREDQPQKAHVYQIGKIKGKPRNTSKKVIRAKEKSRRSFYESDEWRALRYRTLAQCGGECQCCGRSKRKDGVVLHVDHIKPRSLYPHLELDPENLQVLCADCNLGKSNKDATDWRAA